MAGAGNGARFSLSDAVHHHGLVTCGRRRRDYDRWQLDVEDGRETDRGAVRMVLACGFGGRGAWR
jgi:hypothetical protein